MFSSPLIRAIERGLKQDGDLVDELNGLDDYAIRSKEDAKAICETLSTLPTEHSSVKSHSSSQLYALAALFQDVDGGDSPAFEVLYEEGLPQLIRIFDATIERGNEDDDDDLLFVLKILAMYGSLEGAEKVVDAARRPLNHEGYLWHVVLGAFSEGHPQRDYLFRALSDPLPTGFLAIGLLDCANAAAIEEELLEHPFDSQAGWALLQSWLEDPDPNNASYAHSATAALPFISNPAQDSLLALAMEHADIGVQIESAWAAGKLDREVGFSALAEFCLDVDHSGVAQRYLEELNREYLIPAEARDESFQAKAEFSSWLAHPNELGRSPDELEIVDHRELDWPPEREPLPFWLMRFRLRDQTGLEDDEVDCGLVGSATWCFFSYKMHQRPPEDVYAIHCYWEMQHAELIVEDEVTDPSEYAGLLNQWHGNRLESATITRVAEVSPKLNVAARLVALASAKQDGQDGWVVLDGPRSTWYPKAEQPVDTYEAVVLKIHIGRQLLGFQDRPDRKKFLVTDGPVRSPQQYIAAYEKLLSGTSESAPARQDELLGSRSLLARHFDGYVDALVEVDGRDKSDTVICLYERFLDLAAQTDESIRDEAYDSFSALGENFDKYIDALVARGRSADVAELLEVFAPHWDHNLGYGLIATAAFKADHRDVAEQFCVILRDGLDSFYRSEEMSMLAQIWFDRGEIIEARELLIECLRKIVTEIEESKYNSDRQMFADEFRHHRSTFLRLFPAGESELAELGIPADPL